ncbi:hypothetical protein Sjap_001971 [Stephania japonica]|uniref:Uncharacterized protein n=1 Tax=Stephania japonica TaxID=461633 RepID=A0AAP0KKY1_9MAGN
MSELSPHFHHHKDPDALDDLPFFVRRKQNPTSYKSRKQPNLSPRVKLEFDALGVIQTIKNRHKDKFYFKAIIDDCVKLVIDLRSYTISFVCRNEWDVVSYFFVMYLPNI